MPTLKGVINSVCMKGVKGVSREEVISEVQFKVSYISPNEEKIENITGGRNNRNKCRKF